MAAEDRVRCGGTVRELPPPVPVTARFNGYQTSNRRTGMEVAEKGDDCLGGSSELLFLRHKVGSYGSASRLHASGARCWIRGPLGALDTDPVRRGDTGKDESGKSLDTERRVAAV